MKFKEYKQLTGEIKTQISKVGDILRRFDKTPYPTHETDVVCPHFMLLAWANGCPYNCAWCLGEDTLVLMANLKWLPIKQVKTGDKVVGVEFHGKSRKLVATPVLGKAKRRGKAVKLSVEDTSVICSENHRWLTTNDRFSPTINLKKGRKIAYCGKAEPPNMADEDYQKGYVVGLSYGDGCWSLKKPQPFYQLAMMDTEAVQRAKTYIENLTGIKVNERMHQAKRFGSSEIPMIMKRGINNVTKIVKLLRLDYPRETNSVFEYGFLSGFYDAEGSCDIGMKGLKTGFARNILRLSNEDETVLSFVNQYLTDLEFASTIESHAVRLLGGLPSILTFLANTESAIERKRHENMESFGMTQFEHSEVRDMEEIPLLKTTNLYDIQTGTGNFIAEGLISHNCYLKGTFRFYGQKPNGRVPIILKDRKRIAKEVTAFLKADLPPEIINTGELSDSLLDEGENPFSVWLMQYFKDSRHKILFLTKSTNISNFLKHDWQKNVILSWSINAESVAERWELYAPSVEDRLQAAKQVSEAGYEVRLRIDPMVPVDNWKQHYGNLLDRMFELFKPTRVTLGCLRGLTTTIIYCKDKSWTKFLTEKSNWGKKPPFYQRLEMYELIIKELRGSGVKFGICKDTISMWKALNLNPAEIKCNCVW